MAQIRGPAEQQAADLTQKEGSFARVIKREARWAFRWWASEATSVSLQPGDPLVVGGGSAVDPSALIDPTGDALTSDPVSSAVQRGNSDWARRSSPKDRAISGAEAAIA